MDEPEPVPASNGDDEEKKEAGYESNSSPSVGSVAEANGVTEIDSSADNTKDESPSAELLNSIDTVQNVDGDARADSASDTVQNIDGDARANAASDSDVQEQVEVVDVASGSPLPGMKQQLDESVTIPKATIDILKDQVFGFDTFFVTSHEPYEGGILFKGNLRGVPAKSFEKITTRLQNKFGDEYKVFLLINPEDEKPVAVVVPKQTLEPATGAIPEWAAAAVFGVVTIFTLLLRNVPVLQDNLLYEINI